MRFYEFSHPLNIQQLTDKNLKQQARRIQIQQKQNRLRKQRKQAADTAQQRTKLQDKSV